VKRVPAHIYCLVADENVFALYGEQFLAKFKATGKTLFHIVLPSGETTKDRRVKEEVEDFMLRHKMNRDTCCIALGGGVIGDLTGYIAATFMRGVPFVQVPTTLLAMVDASVGGKTAVNTTYGKNLIGAFHQPTVVFMDMGFLDGFSKRDPVRAEREFKAGIAEIIKTGAIWDASLFELCEQKVEAIQRRERAVLNEIVRRSVAIKAEVVTLDPTEQGLRAILNWGHTIGHAVEGLMGMTDYADGLLHGECVAIGMVLECNLARAMGVLHSSAVGRAVRCIEAYKLPTKIPHHLRIDDIMKKMMGDKKNTGGKLKCVIIDKIGHCWEPKASMVFFSFLLLSFSSLPFFMIVETGHCWEPTSLAHARALSLSCRLTCGNQGTRAYTETETRVHAHAHRKAHTHTHYLHMKTHRPFEARGLSVLSASMRWVITVCCCVCAAAWVLASFLLVAG